jgi:hypothetical protein
MIIYTEIHFVIPYRYFKSIQQTKKCALWIVAPQILYLGENNISKLLHGGLGIF